MRGYWQMPSLTSGRLPDLIGFAPCVFHLHPGDGSRAVSRLVMRPDQKCGEGCTFSVNLGYYSTICVPLGPSALGVATAYQETAGPCSLYHLIRLRGSAQQSCQWHLGFAYNQPRWRNLPTPRQYAETEQKSRLDEMSLLTVAPLRAGLEILTVHLPVCHVLKGVKAIWTLTALLLCPQMAAAIPSGLDL